jgi:hypothetical protein
MQTTPAEQAPVLEDHIAQKKARRANVLQAQKDIREDINSLRLQISSQLDELAEIGGEDIYEEAVMTFVNAAGTKGIKVSKLHAVLPDSVALSKARNDLVTKEKIKAEKDGATFKLTPIEGTRLGA